MYYFARLLSSQYQRDFSHAEYDKLRKVYSIWIVMDPSIRNPNIISSIAFRQAALMGDPEDNRVYDKAETFIVRLQKQGALRSEDRLIGILVLSSVQISLPPRRRRFSLTTTAERQFGRRNASGLPLCTVMYGGHRGLGGKPQSCGRAESGEPTSLPGRTALERRWELKRARVHESTD